MLRTPIIAALSVALLAGTAMAQPANQAPSRLSDTARNAQDQDDDDNYAPPPPGAQRGQAPTAQQAAAERDMFCRRDAAARTGYTTPGDAAHDEQVRGTVGGTLGGAALGAIIGGASGNVGAGAAIGAGAGLIAGTAIGADNANHAARDVQAAYGDAYYACMHEDGRSAAGYGYDAPPPGYGYGYPYPPPPGYYGYPYYGPGYYGYGPGYYGPGVSFGFGFGGRGGHGGGFHHR